MGVDPAVCLNQSLSSVPTVADSTVSLGNEDWFGSLFIAVPSPKVSFKRKPIWINMSQYHHRPGSIYPPQCSVAVMVLADEPECTECVSWRTT